MLRHLTVPGLGLALVTQCSYINKRSKLVVNNVTMMVMTTMTIDDDDDDDDDDAHKLC